MSICHLSEINFIYIISTEIPVVNGNSADPDQMTHSVVSDLVLQACTQEWGGGVGGA